MTLREFYLDRRRAELPAFLRVLQALPAGNPGYKPHERSPSAEQLVWTLTKELKACLDVATRHRAEWDPAPAGTRCVEPAGRGLPARTGGPPHLTAV